MSFLKTLLATVLGFFLSMMLVGGFLVAMMIAMVSASGDTRRVSVQSNSLLTIEPQGPLPEYLGTTSFASFTGEREEQTFFDYIEKIEGAKNDPRIRGIWLKLGGFEGSWAQATELRKSLANFKSAGKFIYATSSVGGFNEANYYLATVADSVIMHPVADMEINGIFAAVSFFKPMLDRIGVKAEVVRAGAYKSAVEPFILESASPESSQMMQELVNGTFEVFTSTVQQARGISADDLRAILDGRSLVSASEAQALRLIDATMYEDTFTEMMKKKLSGAKDGDSASSARKLNTIGIDDYEPSVRGDDEEIDEDDNGDRGEVAIVYANGTIQQGESRFTPNPLFGGNVVGDETFVQAMKSAREDDDVKAVVIRVDSPGGDADASEAMWREVVLTKEKKPVIVSMGGVAASGGYFIAAPADTIVADPNTITGSIGAFGLWFNAQGLFEEKLGINTNIFKTNPNADMLTPRRATTPEDRAIMSRYIDTIYQKFLNVVATGRRMSVDSVNAIAQGRVWTGTQAKSIGLVDVLGGLDDAVTIAATRAGLKKGGYDIRVLPLPKDIFETLGDLFGASMANLFTPRTQLDDYRMVAEELERRSGVQMWMFTVDLR